MVSTIVFDLDGVLVQSEPLWRRAFVDVLSAHLGAPITLEQVLEFEGGRVPDTIRTVLRARAGEPSDEKVLLLQDLVIDHASSAFEDHGEVIESSVEAVRALWAADIWTGLASNSATRFIDVVLRRTGLDSDASKHRFRAIGSALEVPNAKPAPDIYLRVAEQLGRNPEDCLAIEDSSPGVKAAKAAGMECVGLWRKVGVKRPAEFSSCAWTDYDLDVNRLLKKVGAQRAEVSG